MSRWWSNPHLQRLAGEAAICAALIAAFYYSLLAMPAIGGGGDALNLFWPMKELIRESLARGVVPLWNPWSWMGAPLHGALQHAVFYPVDRIVHALMPAWAAFNVGCVLHLMLAGVGMWWWLRVGVGVGCCAAIMGGVAFPCGGWFWGHTEHPNILAVVAWMPWIVAVGWLHAGGRIGGRCFVAAMAALVALQFLAGHPQEVYYALLVAVPLAAARAWRVGGCMARWLSAWMAAGALAGLLVGVQLLPTSELAALSRRTTDEAGHALAVSLPPRALVMAVAPHYHGSFKRGWYHTDESGAPAVDAVGNPMVDFSAWGEYGIFVGAPVLLLALGGLLMGRRRLGWALAAMAVGAVLLAMGGNTAPSRIWAGEFTEYPAPGGGSLLEWWVRIFPPAGAFRVAARYLLCWSFCIVVLAALGLDALLARRALAGRRCLYGAAAIGLVYTSLLVPSLQEKFRHPASLEDVLILRRATAEGGDATLDRRLYRMTLEDDDVYLRERLHATSGHAPASYRYLAMQPHLHALRPVPVVEGYEEGLLPTLRTHDFLREFNRNLRAARPDPLLLNLLGVRHVYTDLPLDEVTYPRSAALETLPGRLYQNPGATGAAFWRSQVGALDFARLDGPAARGAAPRADLNREAVDLAAAWTTVPPEARPTTEILTMNHLRIYAGTTPAEGDAVLAMAAYPGWIHKVSGQIAGAFPVQFLSAVHAELPRAYLLDHPKTGPPNWDLWFRPESYRVGLFLTAVGLALWGALIVQRRHRAAPRPEYGCPSGGGWNAGPVGRETE